MWSCPLEMRMPFGAGFQKLPLNDFKDFYLYWHTVSLFYTWRLGYSWFCSVSENLNLTSLMLVMQCGCCSSLDIYCPSANCPFYLYSRKSTYSNVEQASNSFVVTRATVSHGYSVHSRSSKNWVLRRIIYINQQIVISNSDFYSLTGTATSTRRIGFR